MKMVLKTLVFFLLFSVLAYFFYNNRWQLVNIVKSTGLIKDTVLVSGTGSMYPTFPKGTGDNIKELGKEIVADAKMLPYPLGISIFEKTFFDYKIQHGDIVSFSSDITSEITTKLYGSPSGYIKRVIGLPNDTIELRNGIVYLNDAPQKEPYTALSHSTFGGTFLPECKKLTIPSGQIFVLGDNRKASSDSRSELGLVSLNDVDHVIPFSEQKDTLAKNWRDTSLDLSDQTKIKLIAADLLNLLNKERSDSNVKLLRLESKLNVSASLRAKNILEHNDFSFDGSKSGGYDMKKAMSDAGYSNIVWGEVPVQGYYTAEELMSNLLEFPKSKDFILNKEFSDFGVSTVEGNIENCPTQIIVLHLAGYVPPNYSSDLINSWKTFLSKLKEIQPSWESLKKHKEFYSEHKNEIDRINEIIDYRINAISNIVKKLENQVWLSDEENSYNEKDQKLNDEQNNLAKKLNDSSD